MSAAANSSPAVRSPPTGLPEVVAVWLLFALGALAVCSTYARIPPESIYHTSVDGLPGGLGRTLVYLGFPAALAALATLPVSWTSLHPRLRRGPLLAAALTAVVLCATIVLPDVIEQEDLDAKPVNALAAAGVAVALGLTVLAAARAGLGRPHPFASGDWIRLGLAALLVLGAIPWWLAESGFYASDVPVLEDIFLAKELRPEPGDETLRAVHLGHHHGTDGVLLALAGLLLSRVISSVQRGRLRTAFSLSVSFLLVYGVMNAAQDFWLEQVVKRGTSDVHLPYVVRPALSWGWIVLVAASVALHVLLTRAAALRRPAAKAANSASR